MKTLDFKANKTEVLTFDELKQTVKAKSIGQKAYMEHFEIIERLMELTSKVPGFSPVPANIIAQGGASARIIDAIEEIHGKNALQAHWLQKIIGKISLGVFGNEEFGPSIGYSFNEKGITVAIGQNVKICDNFSILGSELAQTYGNEKVSYDRIFELVEHWLMKMEAIWKRDTEFIGQLKNILIDPQNDGVYGLIGRMLYDAVGGAYHGGESFFAISDVSAFVNKFRSFPDEKLAGGISLWEFYNIGTNILNPHSTNATTIFQNNKGFGDFIKAYYNKNSHNLTVVVEGVVDQEKEINPGKKEEPVPNDSNQKEESREKTVSEFNKSAKDFLSENSNQKELFEEEVEVEVVDEIEVIEDESKSENFSEEDDGITFE